MNVNQILQSMDYGTAPEASDQAELWLGSHKGQFGNYINGKFTKPEALFPTNNPATLEPLASISQASAETVKTAIASARNAQPEWEDLGGQLPECKWKYLITL